MRKTTQYLKSLDRKHVWHPFTQMKEWTSDEILVVEEGRGAWLKDTDGKWYLDGISSLWVTVHGHRCKEIDKAVKKQIGQIAHSTLLGLANIPSILLAKRLIEISPRGLKKVFYSDAGATSVEIALKMAHQYWHLKGENRPWFIKFSDAYHGDTIGSVSVGGIKMFHDIFSDLLFKTYRAPWPHTYWKPRNYSLNQWKNYCLTQLEELLRKKAKTIAGLITEPLIQGASGMATAPAGFLKGVEQLCRKYGVLLIVDEVATGFGRTGKMFACEWEHVRPDLMCVAKGLTGGYLPLAATLATDKIFRAYLGKYSEFKTFFHGHTYTGNPLGCSAALASLNLFKKKRILEKLQKKIQTLQSALLPLKDLSHVGDIRQKGFMVGIELVENKEKQVPFLLEEKMAIKVCRFARTQNVILRPLGNVVVLMPPLGIEKKDILYLANAVRESILKITGN
ncbi:MAG: adenosylmethionine--8-amino-7-oxononanoate transaminase [Candidatus Aureabacteria bacterium]|nr:adenosylmethionine--8-amino-7-oxononanoate transaminase [Candidatus Auribacterota bacterium]